MAADDEFFNKLEQFMRKRKAIALAESAAVCAAIRESEYRALGKLPPERNSHKN